MSQWPFIPKSGQICEYWAQNHQGGWDFPGGVRGGGTGAYFFAGDKLSFFRSFHIKHDFFFFFFFLGGGSGISGGTCPRRYAPGGKARISPKFVIFF